jgi:DAD family
MQTSERLPPGASAEAKKAAAKRVDSATGDVVEDVEGGNGARVSSERAFADFVFGSLILHGFCVNFIN